VKVSGHFHSSGRFTPLPPEKEPPPPLSVEQETGWVSEYLATVGDGRFTPPVLSVEQETGWVSEYLAAVGD